VTGSLVNPRHFDGVSTCVGCGAVWQQQSITHADTCTYLAGVNADSPQYGPAWIAGCYGVEPTDPCPTVTLPSAE